MIRFQDVSFSYPGASEPALKRVSLTLASGEMIVVVGRNGSGKSTLARMANGLLLPSAGEITVEGLLTTDPNKIWEIRSDVGVVFQNPDNQIVGTMVEEDVAFGPENLGMGAEEIRERVDEALAAVSLTGFERREPHQLSGGQKQRLAIAGALALRPRYLVLDEPTSMLDLQGRADVLGVLVELREQGVGILHITHHLADALNADKVIALDQGEVVYEGPSEGLLADDALLERLGLELPPIGLLAKTLADAGVSIDRNSFDSGALVSSLWR